MESLELAKAAAAAAFEKKAKRVLIYNVNGVSDIADYQVICSGDNERQTRAIAEAIMEKCKKTYKVIPSMIEGQKSGHWILVDYGPVIIHVFFDYIRDYYALEELWAKGQRVSTIGLDPQPAESQPS